MNGLTPPDKLDRPKPTYQRSSSISNDRASLSVVPLACPPSVRPDPAYIAPSSASQIVTGDREMTFEDEDDDRPISPGATNTLVAPNALLLVNTFLDQLLYSFLVSSRSTSIAALRPAVTEVLKPRLAKDAIASADEELQEFLGGGDDDELSSFHDGFEPRASWDMNKVWRRTRLRCMVYTRLGDLEEEDEDMWVERENADHQENGQHRLSRDLGVVSPAAAIFLTSILEFVGEQVLLVSAEAAYTRFEARRRQEKSGSGNPVGVQRLSVEVVDIEKLAVNTTFGRLWRSWKKRVRSPSRIKQRPSSHEYFLRPTSSLSAGDPQSHEPSVGEEGEEGKYDQDHALLLISGAADDPGRVQEAAAIPLPTTTYDAEEIQGAEFPWQSSGGDIIGRPRSTLLSSGSYQAVDQYKDARAGQARHGLLQRNRSSSLPLIAYRQYPDPHGSPYSTPQEDAFAAESQTSPPSLSRYDSDPSAVVTMYDGAIARVEDATDGNKDRKTNHTGASHEQLDQEALVLDEGLDSLGRTSHELECPEGRAPADSAILSSSDTFSVNNKKQTSPEERPLRSGVTNQQLPSRIESRLDSPRMQGHTTENVSLDNRETSIVETKPSPTSENRAVTADLPYGKASQSKDGRDEASLSSPTSYANHDRSNGASIATTGVSTQQYASLPRSHPETGGSLAPIPFPTFPQAKPSVKLSKIRKQLPPVSTGVERASVQRVSWSPGGALESPVCRTSTSSSRELRPVRTSGSNTSPTATKPTVLGTRGSSDISRQSAISRRSSEASNKLAAPLVQTPEVDETQRSFEQLIKSDETIQFTLTPESVRETDSLDSPRYSHSRTGTAELADFIRTSGPQLAEMDRPSTNRSIVSLKGLNGLRPNSTATAKPAATQPTAPSLEKPQMQSQRSRPTTTRSAQRGPRDPQLGTETTQDFADFIRSTGPEVVNQPRMKDKVTTPPPSKSRPNRGLTPDQRSTLTTSTGRKITKPNPSLSKSLPQVAAHNAPPKRTASKLQAREATYEPTHNEDLLEFLKQGPADDRGIEKRPMPGPVASVVPQNPRIPPNLRDKNSETRSSVASTQDSAFANWSIRSTNSRTGLLDSTKSSQPGSPPQSQRPPRFDEPPQVRKQRRVKDPYAIDSDSEDDGRPETPKPQRQKESLIDFLNSPPPLSNPTPIIPSAFDDIPNPTIPSNNISNVNNKTKSVYNQRNARTIAAATPGIRSAVQAPISNPKPQQASRGRPTNPSPSGQSPQLPPLNSRDISPHLITTYNPKPSTTSQPTGPHSNLNGTTTTSTATSTTVTSSTPAERPVKRVKPAGIARSEREGNSRGMADLADFLRNSEPPTQVPREMLGRKESAEEKEPGGGIWGRIKKRRGR
ncbi:MAG: hypothetical protein Q9166_007086 [cf. Caloplaca sp. 2 TL-2023]